MEYKTISLELKAKDNMVEGYGARFGNEDSYGDVIDAGAFAASLSRRKPKMLREHAPNKLIGVWDEVSEDRKGLRVKGRFADTPLGQETRSLVQIGALDGLSIGYRTVKSEARGNVRALQELDLWEVSLVTFPANEEARVDAAKAMSLGDFTPFKRLIEQSARDAGCSAREAKAAAAAAAKELSAMRDAGDALGELLNYMRQFNN